MLGIFAEIPIQGIVNPCFSLLSGCVFLKKIENEKSLPNILHVVLLIGSANHIIISTKHPKNDQKIFTHNLPRVLPTICLYPQSRVNHFIVMSFCGFEIFHKISIFYQHARSCLPKTWLAKYEASFQNLFCS